MRYREQILTILDGELTYLAGAREMAQRVLDLGGAYIDAIQESARSSAASRESGSVDWAREAMLLPLEDLAWYPTMGHIRTPMDQARKIIDACDTSTSQIRCAMMQIQESQERKDE